MQVRINAAAAALVLTYPAHAAEKFRVLFSIFDLPFANSDKILKQTWLGKHFTETVKKKFTSGSKINLDLTVCKKRCVQKTST